MRDNTLDIILQKGAGAMFRLIVSIFVVMLFIPSIVHSANNKNQVPELKTKIEKFSALEGIVFIKGFENMGEVAGDRLRTSVSVDCREFINAFTGEKSYGISIAVTERGRFDKQNTSFIDYDEIASLISGIDYISKVTNESTKLSNFQADYKTKGDLEISTFSSEGTILAAISSGRIGRTTSYHYLSSLPKIKDLIIKAKEKLDSIK